MNKIEKSWWDRLRRCRISCKRTPKPHLPTYFIGEGNTRTSELYHRHWRGRAMTPIFNFDSVCALGQ